MRLTRRSAFQGLMRTVVLVSIVVCASAFRRLDSDVIFGSMLWGSILTSWSSDLSAENWSFLRARGFPISRIALSPVVARWLPQLMVLGGLVLLNHLSIPEFMSISWQLLQFNCLAVGIHRFVGNPRPSILILAAVSVVLPFWTSNSGTFEFGIFDPGELVRGLLLFTALLSLDLYQISRGQKPNLVDQL